MLTTKEASDSVNTILSLDPSILIDKNGQLNPALLAIIKTHYAQQPNNTKLYLTIIDFDAHVVSAMYNKGKLRFYIAPAIKKLSESTNLDVQINTLYLRWGEILAKDLFNQVYAVFKKKEFIENYYGRTEEAITKIQNIKLPSLQNLSENVFELFEQILTEVDKDYGEAVAVYFCICIRYMFISEKGTLFKAFFPSMQIQGIASRENCPVVHLDSDEGITTEINEKTSESSLIKSIYYDIEQDSRLMLFVKRALARLNSFNLNSSTQEELEKEFLLEDEQAKFEKAVQKYGVFSWLASLTIPSSNAYKARANFSKAVQKLINQELQKPNTPNTQDENLIAYHRFWKGAHLNPSWSKTVLIMVMALLMAAIALTGIGILIDLGIIGGIFASLGFMATLGHFALTVTALSASSLTVVATITTSISSFIGILLIKELKDPGIMAYDFFDGLKQIRVDEKLDGRDPFNTGVLQIARIASPQTFFERALSISNATFQALNIARLINFGLYHLEKLLINSPLGKVKGFAVSCFIFFEVLRLGFKGIEAVIDLVIDSGFFFLQGIGNYIAEPIIRGLIFVGEASIEFFKSDVDQVPSIAPSIEPNPKVGGSPYNNTKLGTTAAGPSSTQGTSSNYGKSSQQPGFFPSTSSSSSPTTTPGSASSTSQLNL